MGGQNSYTSFSKSSDFVPVKEYQAKAEKKGNDKTHQRKNQRGRASKQSISENARSDLQNISKRICK